MNEKDELRHKIYKNERKLREMLPIISNHDKIKFKSLTSENRELIFRFNELDKKIYTYK